VVQAAVDFTCHEFESRGGSCTPEVRKALAAAYQKAIDQIQSGIVRTAKEPGCGDKEAAHEHGREPLPCFSKYAGADVRPAAGAVTEPAALTVRVKRAKPDPEFATPGCRLAADLELENFFPGGNVHGVTYGPSKLQGYPFLPAETVVPALALGKTADLTLVFTRYRPFALPGHYNATLWWDDWLYLYRGGKGPLSAGANTVTPVPGAKAADGTTLKLACAGPAEKMVEIPE
jgi:hypothetical protein